MAESDLRKLAQEAIEDVGRGAGPGVDIVYRWNAATTPERILALLDRQERLVAALRELVACKDLKQQITSYDRSSWCDNSTIANADEYRTACADYERRKPLAWAAARALCDGVPKDNS